MDTAYITWILLIVGGAFLGVFIKPKHIVVCGVALMACALAGLILSGVFGGGNLTVLFGVVAMAIPVVFAMLALGAWIGAAIVGRVRRNRVSS